MPTTCLVLYVTNDRHFVFSVLSWDSSLLFRHDYKRWDDADEGRRPAMRPQYLSSCGWSLTGILIDAEHHEGISSYHTLYSVGSDQWNRRWSWKAHRPKRRKKYCLCENLRCNWYSVCVVMPLLSLGTFHPFAVFFGHLNKDTVIFHHVEIRAEECFALPR